MASGITSGSAEPSRLSLHTIYYKGKPVCSCMASGRWDAREQFIADMHAEQYRKDLTARRANV